MDDRRTGVALLAIGAVIAGIGLVGFALDRPAQASTVAPSASPAGSVAVTQPTAAPPSATPVATPAVTPTAVPTPAPTASPTPDPETLIRAFYVTFVPAYRSGDADTLIALLHPAALERYGEATCRTSFTQSRDPKYDIAVKTVHPPEPWDYARDDRSTTIPDAVAIDVDVTTTAGKTAAVVHLAPVDGEFRWFADCGTPLPSPAP